MRNGRRAGAGSPGRRPHVAWRGQPAADGEAVVRYAHRKLVTAGSSCNQGPHHEDSLWRRVGSGASTPCELISGSSMSTSILRRSTRGELVEHRSIDGPPFAICSII